MKTDKKPRRNFQKKLNKKSLQEANEIAELELVIAEQAPARGTNPLLQKQQQQQEEGEQGAPGGNAAQPTTLVAARKFEELPISRYSKEALREAKFVTMTAIQRAALPHALCGRDVLGAAKTGSGKTLAFLLPVSWGGAGPAAPAPLGPSRPTDRLTAPSWLR
jgi:ATP-dependent RNA helicase DDX10/DBP4